MASLTILSFRTEIRSGPSSWGTRSLKDMANVWHETACLQERAGGIYVPASVEPGILITGPTGYTCGEEVFVYHGIQTVQEAGPWRDAVKKTVERVCRVVGCPPDMPPRILFTSGFYEDVQLDG